MSISVDEKNLFVVKINLTEDHIHQISNGLFLSASVDAACGIIRVDFQKEVPVVEELEAPKIQGE